MRNLRLSESEESNISKSKWLKSDAFCESHDSDQTDPSLYFRDIKKFLDWTHFAMVLMKIDGSFLYANGRFKDLFGYDLIEIPGVQQFVNKVIADKESQKIAGASWLYDIRNIPLHGEDISVFAARCKDGTKKRINFRIECLEEGQYLLSCEDITREDPSEKKARHARSKLENLIESLPDATFAVDEKRRVIAWNRATEELTGVMREEVLGKGDQIYSIPIYNVKRPVLIDLVFDPDLENEIKCHYNYVIRKGLSFYAGGIFNLPNGRTIDLLGVASPIFDEDGELAGAIESVLDIANGRGLNATFAQARYGFIHSTIACLMEWHFMILFLMRKARSLTIKLWMSILNLN